MSATKFLLVPVLAVVVAICSAAPADVVSAAETKSTAETTSTTPHAVSPNDVDSTHSQLVSNDSSPVHRRFPHAVLFGRTCGGTIISPKWILTAGHCTLFMSRLSVVAGTDQTDDDSGVYRKVKRLVIHPRFSVGPYWLDHDEYGFKQVAARFDFLLVELEDPLPLDGNDIAAATLDEQQVHPGGEHVGYAGFGADYHGGTMSHTMHERELATVEDAKCAKQLVEFDKQDMICTQGRSPRYDSGCNGDSGSGLVSSSGKLLGVASWVEDDAFTCRPRTHVVFSRVAAARDWIRQVTSV